MTGRTITKAFALCAVTYGVRFQIPADPSEANFMAETWADLLDDVPDELGLAVFRRYCATESRPPTPADIRRLASPQNALPTPGEAWAEVTEKARTVGYNDGNVPEMSTPEIRAAAASGFWYGICLSDTVTDLNVTRSQFLKVYEGLCSRTEREMEQVAIGGCLPKELLPRMKMVDGGTT